MTLGVSTGQYSNPRAALAGGAEILHGLRDQRELRSRWRRLPRAAGYLVRESPVLVLPKLRGEANLSRGGLNFVNAAIQMASVADGLNGLDSENRYAGALGGAPLHIVS